MSIPAGVHVRSVRVEGIGTWVWPEKDYWGFKQPAEEFPLLRDLILSHTEERGCIVQAGGCCGMYPRLWSDHFAQVYTFEPDPVNFYCLVANCGDKAVIKIEAALSDHAGTCPIKRGPEFNVGMHRIGEGEGPTPVLRLDDFRLPKVDVIQLDCEEGEFAAIRGAMETIKRCRPLLALEAPRGDLPEFLSSIGYFEVGRCGSNPDVLFAHQSAA